MQDEGYGSVPCKMSPHFNATGTSFDDDDDDDESVKKGRRVEVGGGREKRRFLVSHLGRGHES